MGLHEIVGCSSRGLQGERRIRLPEKRGAREEKTARCKQLAKRAQLQVERGFLADVTAHADVRGQESLVSADERAWETAA